MGVVAIEGVVDGAGGREWAPGLMLTEQVHDNSSSMKFSHAPIAMSRGVGG
jgi:hypothetical protein